MQLSHILKTICLSILVFLPQAVLATADTTKVRPDTSKVPVSEEIVLDEIFIEAVIEKPNVAILPSRVESDFGEIEFIDRSFEIELKQGVDRQFFFDDKFERAKKVEKLKAILRKE